MPVAEVVTDEDEQGLFVMSCTQAIRTAARDLAALGWTPEEIVEISADAIAPPPTPPWTCPEVDCFS